MKKTQFTLTLLLITGFVFSAMAQNSGSRGEEILIKKGDKCLAVMEKAALGMSVKGVALIAFIPGDTAISWTSKMQVVGALKNASANYLAIAYSKAAEMADTYLDSGSGSREILHGEFGYMGGTIKKVDSGYILAVFSGASGEQDLEIANAGLEWLLGYY